MSMVKRLEIGMLAGDLKANDAFINNYKLLGP
jgi:hypothetical protein